MGLANGVALPLQSAKQGAHFPSVDRLVIPRHRRDGISITHMQVSTHKVLIEPLFSGLVFIADILCMFFYNNPKNP